jgi:predicted DNA-binding protein (MmcQ/YjbR family)
MQARELLKRIRKICLALPEAEEGVSFGHPWFRVRGKGFAIFEEYADEPVLVVKIGKEMLDVFLPDPRFVKAPYIGRHGWVCLKLGKSPDWEEVAELVQGSYGRIAPRKRNLRPRRS